MKKKLFVALAGLAIAGSTLVAPAAQAATTAGPGNGYQVSSCPSGYYTWGEYRMLRADGKVMGYARFQYYKGRSYNTCLSAYKTALTGKSTWMSLNVGGKRVWGKSVLYRTGGYVFKRGNGACSWATTMSNAKGVQVAKTSANWCPGDWMK